jgi:chromate reductase, NAD(P)H dehydrogenase (quinone)
MQQPEAYIGGAATIFDKEGNITNEGIRKFLKGFMEAFAEWVEVLIAR